MNKNDEILEEIEDNEYSFFWLQNGELKNSDEQTAEEYLKEFREEEIKPLSSYAMSSVETNMFLTHFNEVLKIAKPKDKEELIKKANKMIEKTPYTNYSGD